ncbi:MAG: hypothetical protein FJ267_19700 [Planctomycetes bacterium]|nr:hypothetical protein [Planctomycetota bacterium]
MVYSVDLVFRFLPDLVRIVKGMNSSDPLLERLKEWGRQWPLSSVSIPDLLVTEIEPILADRCLSQLYADRIIESGSTDRLNDPRVREMIRGQFGAYLEMNDKFHKYFGNEREE